MTQKQFKPAWWLKNPHLQTCYPALFSKKHTLTLQSEQVVMSDGAKVCVRWSQNSNEDKPLLVLLHGMGGSAQAHYIQRMILKAVQNGFKTACVQVRTHTKNSQKIISHAGFTQDLEEVMAFFLKNKQCPQKIYIVGYSLGGNVLLKWLSESLWASRIQAACAVSVPFDLLNSVRCLNKGFAKIYQWILLKYLRGMAFSEFNIISNDKTIYNFDHNITAKLGGFKHAVDYYTHSSSKKYLAHILTPTLLVQAKDDPFLSPECIPLPSVLPNNIELCVTEGGGHLGFVAGHVPFKPQYWLETRVINYFLNF